MRRNRLVALCGVILCVLFSVASANDTSSTSSSDSELSSSDSFASHPMMHSLLSLRRKRSLEHELSESESESASSSSSSAFHAQGDGTSDSSSAVSNNIWIAVGSGGFFLVATVVCIVCVYRYHKKQKKERESEAMKSAMERLKSVQKHGHSIDITSIDPSGKHIIFCFSLLPPLTIMMLLFCMLMQVVLVVHRWWIQAERVFWASTWAMIKVLKYSWCCRECHHQMVCFSIPFCYFPFSFSDAFCTLIPLTIIIVIINQW